MYVFGSVKTLRRQDVFQQKTPQRQTTTEACFAITCTASGRSTPFPPVTLRFRRPTVWNNTEMQAPKCTRFFISPLYCPVGIHTIAHRSGGRMLSSLMENCRPLRPSLSQQSQNPTQEVVSHNWTAKHHQVRESLLYTPPTLLIPPPPNRHAIKKQR